MRLSKFNFFFLLFLSGPLQWATSSSIAKASNISEIKNKRALVLGIDGMRGDVFDLASKDCVQFPNLCELRKSGAFASCDAVNSALCAQAHLAPLDKKEGKDNYWITGPGWLSVVTGVSPLKHRVNSNSSLDMAKYIDVRRQYPSFFKILKDSQHLRVAAGGTANFLTASDGMGTFPGAVDYECVEAKKNVLTLSPSEEDRELLGLSEFDLAKPALIMPAPYLESSCNLNERKSLDNANEDRDENLTQWALQQINGDLSDVIMVVFDKVDSAGHSFGFSNNKGYLDALKIADTQIGQLLSAVRETSVSKQQNWLVLLTSDHGGHEKAGPSSTVGDHGKVFPDDAIVPFGVAVIGSTVDLKLQDLKQPVSQMDVFPTVLTWFDVKSVQVDGRVQVLEEK